MSFNGFLYSDSSGSVESMNSSTNRSCSISSQSVPIVGFHSASGRISALSATMSTGASSVDYPSCQPSNIYCANNESNNNNNQLSQQFYQPGLNTQKMSSVSKAYNSFTGSTSSGRGSSSSTTTHSGSMGGGCRVIDHGGVGSTTQPGQNNKFSTISLGELSSSPNPNQMVTGDLQMNQSRRTSTGGSHCGVSGMTELSPCHQLPRHGRTSADASGPMEDITASVPSLSGIISRELSSSR